MARNPTQPNQSRERPQLRVALHPFVYVLSRPSFLFADAAEFLRREGEQAGEKELTWKHSGESSQAELLVEFAGRVCYMSFGKQQGRTDTHDYLTNILEMRHGSVLEHSCWSLLITDVSRSLSHELVRHRQFSFSQQSSRYVTARREAVMPPALQRSGQVDTMVEWQLATERAFDAQEKLVAEYESWIGQATDAATKRRLRKQAREVGRSVMPHDAVTRLVMTGNARAWRWLIEVRGTEDVDPEMRQLACVIALVLKAESPILFGDIGVESGSDGELRTVVTHSKV